MRLVKKNYVTLGNSVQIEKVLNNKDNSTCSHRKFVEQDSSTQVGRELESSMFVHVKFVEQGNSTVVIQHISLLFTFFPLVFFPSYIV